MKKQIHITKPDYLKLSAIMDSVGSANKQLQQWVDLLEQELDRANIVDSHKIPKRIITLHSRVRLRDLDSDETQVYKLALPSEAHRVEAGMSVLAPVGIAMLGYGEGDKFECVTPGGTRRFQVEEVLFQPEAEAKRKRLRNVADPQPAAIQAI